MSSEQQSAHMARAGRRFRGLMRLLRPGLIGGGIGVIVVLVMGYAERTPETMVRIGLTNSSPASVSGVTVEAMVAGDSHRYRRHTLGPGESVEILIPRRRRDTLWAVTVSLSSSKQLGAGMTDGKLTKRFTTSDVLVGLTIEVIGTPEAEDGVALVERSRTVMTERSWW